MPAIVAYSGPPSGDPKQERILFREGMQTLGQLLLDATKKEKNTEAKKAKGVRDALQEVMKAKDHELRFQNSKNSANGERGFKITKVTSSGNSLECVLTDQSGDPVGTLILEVKLDSTSDLTGLPKDHEYYMRVSFPEANDDKNAFYLGEIAAHLKEIVNSGPTALDNAKKFLAAFKFLSRCK